MKQTTNATTTVKHYKMSDVIANNAGQQLSDCKSSPWVDTSHESCSSSESESNIIVANKSPYVAMSWQVVSQTPGSEQVKHLFLIDQVEEQLKIISGTTIDGTYMYIGSMRELTDPVP